jgi:hypothetical protein
MRTWIYRVLLAALWIGGMGLLISTLLAFWEDGGNAAIKITLLAGGFLASVSTVALAEEV